MFARPALVAPLAASVNDGELRAFEALVAQHLPGLRVRAAQLCRASVDPDDLIQDALIRAFRGRAQLRSPAGARSWLLSIVSNTFIDLVRKQRARPQVVSLEVAPEAGAEAIEPLPWEHITTDDLRTAIAGLPDDVRDTYRLFALEHKNYIEIAAALHIPKATVGTRLARARKRLRGLLVVALKDTP